MQRNSKTGTAGSIEALFDTLYEAVVLCDPDLRVQHLNRSACDLLGVSARSAQGKGVHEILDRGVLVEIGNAGPARTIREWSMHLGVGSHRRVIQARAITLEHRAGWALFLHSVGSDDQVPPFVGRSTATQELLEFVSRIAASRASSVLLAGETGTGKEVIAKRLHALSSRSRSRFMAMNCAALPEALLEGELFGYERGAFTDARTTKPGLVEAANGGTLFLDEIGEMPLSLQVKLLRVLEERTVRRLGGVDDIKLDIRVIAATNRNLAEAIENMEFRSDLYYRLNVVQIHIPALRERPEDVEDLALHFLDTFNRIHQRHICGIQPRTLQLLVGQSWPGNVRELRNVIERAVLMENSASLTPGSIALPSNSPRSHRPPATRSQHAPLCLRSTEREMIAAALTQSSGNQTHAANLLGIGRFSLRYKMRKLGLL
jgi:two-component system, NtrC family, response regulator AtoC